jgi:hypothetical protein
MAEHFPVEVRGLEHLRGPERQVIFHGVNKSGSLVMTDVLMRGYYRARRANQFFTTYKGMPHNPQLMRRIIANSSGHAFFGGHYLYGSYPARPAKHLLTTQFRNPLPRARSCYEWLRAQDSVDGLTFLQWLDSRGGLTHSQVRQFSVGYGGDAERHLGLSMEDHLARALEAIERDVRWFGIAEYFEESAFTMAALCGLPSIPAWTRDDRNAGRPLVDSWAPEEVEAVQHVYRADFELYAWALERFRQNLARLEFTADLDRYKAACAGQYKDRLDVSGRPIEATPAG